MKAAAAIAVVALVATACSADAPEKSGQSGDAKASAPVSVKLLAFAPNALTVKAGTAVTWTNDEPVDHTVTSGEVTGVDGTSGLRTGEKADGKFDSPLTGKGATYSYTFAEPGTYAYYCAIHKGMNASVVVT